MGPKAKGKAAKAKKESEKDIQLTEDEDEIEDDPDEEICIDMHLGTPVFGYRDSKTGKFFPQSNFSFTVMSYCNGDRFSFPSWQLEVQDRKKTSFVLVPEYMERSKEVTNHISAVLKRSFFSTIPDKKFKDYFRTQLINHINTKDVKRLIVSYTGYQEDDINPDDVTTFQLVIGHQVLDENGCEKKEHKYVFAPDVVQKKVDKTSNVAKLVPLTLTLLPVNEAKNQFKRVIMALPKGASTWPCKMLASGYMLLFASPVTNKIPLFNNAPLIALIGTTSLGKTQTSMVLNNHFSDKVYMENGTTSSASLEAKIKTTSLPFLGDDFRSLETESKICNIAYDKIGTTTKTGGSLNDPQAPLAFSTNIDDPRPPRVAGRLIFITMRPWMDKVTTEELDKMKVEAADLSSTKEKALPYIASLVKRAVDSSFKERFGEIRNSPLVQELPIKADQRLSGFYSLLFTWMAELSHEFPGFFDREECMKWVKETLAKELKHYHAIDDSSKRDLEAWLIEFSSEIGSMTPYQVLRVARLCTPLKECEGQQCLMISRKNSPSIRGYKITSFMTVVGNIGGSTSSVQQMLRLDCMDVKIITKPKELKNTESKRCMLIPLHSLSKECKRHIGTAFGVKLEGTSETEDSTTETETDTDEEPDVTDVQILHAAPAVKAKEPESTVASPPLHLASDAPAAKKVPSVEPEVTTEGATSVAPAAKKVTSVEPEVTCIKRRLRPRKPSQK